ncbi:MAG: hypothetical protein HYU86_09700 [Chloroflexi bacterium]|nr:hypothetical protein [Chloroflexota bacterium]
MGFVLVKGLTGKDAETAREVEFLIDSGSFYTLLPPGLAHDLGIALPGKGIVPSVTTRVMMADSRTLEMGVGIAYLRLPDREAAVPVGMMEVSLPLLGVTALEGLGLKIDPVGGTVEPTRPFGPAALFEREIP